MVLDDDVIYTGHTKQPPVREKQNQRRLGEPDARMEVRAEHTDLMDARVDEELRIRDNKAAGKPLRNKIAAVAKKVMEKLGY
jgi:hypothetical protein